MKLEVSGSESEVIQKDGDFYPSDTIVEQAGNQHALLKTSKSMDKEEEDISGDASEEVYISPETTAEKIKACLPETGIKLTAPSISSVDESQYTHDDIRHEIHSVEKGDVESPLPKEQDAEIKQTILQECSSIKMGDSINNDSEVTDVEHEKNKINAEVSQISSMLLKPDIEETAEYVSDGTEEENFSEQILPPIKEKAIEQPFYEESPEVGNNIGQLKAEDDSSMKTTEVQVQNTHIPLTADQEDKSPQDLSCEKESDNERMSPENAQQISEEISESRNVSCADEEAEPTSESQESYQEILEPSQIICERANDSKENTNDNSTEREVTTSTEEILVDSSSTIEECSKQIESEIYESKTIRSEDGAYVDQLAEHATIEATEKRSQVGLAAVTGPANIQENDEHQTCQTEVEENETISEIIKQNQSFPESDLQEKNVISTESISYNNANMTNAALEGDNNERVELKAEETGYSFEEENVETATREPYSSDQISSADEISVPFSEKGDSAISSDSDKISSLNDNGNMESIDTETKLDMMQELENKREIVVETASDDITEEINDGSYMVSENQVDDLTNKATDEPGLTVDSRQNIPLPVEDQINMLTDVREKAHESVGENNAIEEENDSIRSPDKDPEKDSESNNEEIQNDSKPGQSCRNEADIVKHLEIVNPEIEETKLDQGEQTQENSIHNDAIGPGGDAQSTFTNIEPTSPENREVKIDEIMEATVSEIEQKNIDNMELQSVRDVTSAEENLEDSTNSAVAENNVTSEASINKDDDQNENQSLNVTCVQTGTEAEDAINKTDDSEKGVDLQCTEETQSVRDATVESFQSAITDEMEDDKNLENTNADPSQEHDEINNKNSNYDEESNEYKEQEPNEANEFHSEDESKTEAAKTQVYEEGSSSNKEGIRTVEVSQRQDEYSKVHEDSIHDIEVEDTTDKQHEEQEDRSAYGEHDDGVLGDQVKPMNAGMDSQNENELNTSNSDGVHAQENQTERESCKYDEMDEPDSRKDKEIISQEFEQDKLVNEITSQESSLPIEPLEHNLGAAMDDPTVSQPSEIVNDEALTAEASKAAGLEAEQHMQTNEDPEQENYISADKSIQADSAEHITNSAIGYEDSTIFAEANKHGSADHLKVVDCNDDEHAENLQESESENQGLATKEVDTAIVANKDDNFDQLPKDLQHNNDVQNFENEGAQKDGQQVLLEAGSDVEEFQEMNANPMELSENTGTESDNIEVQNDGGDEEEGVCDDTAKTVPVTDPKIEGEISTGFPSQSGKLDQESNVDDPIKSRDEDTGESSEAMQVVDIHEEVSADCHVSSTDPGTDIQQENESNTASLDCKQEQEDQRGHESFKNSKMDDSHPEKDIELTNQGFEQDSISSVMPCQETSATIEALRQDIGTAIDDHTQNEPSEIANDKVHIVEVSKEADLETDQHNQTNEEPEHENEISEEESMDIENRKFIPESELREVNNTENEAINSRAAELDSNTAEDLSGNENANSEISQTVTKLDEDPKVNTEVMPQHMSIENRELAPESAEVEEEKNTENEAINSRAEDLGSNTVGDNGNENTNLEISQQEINTEVVIQDMDVENNVLIPESTNLREENSAENEAINSRAADLGSNTVEDLSGTENTHSEISQKVAKLDEDPGVNTEVTPQDTSVKNRELITESAELTEENNTESEAINSRAGDLGSNTVEDSGSENTNLEISQTEIGSKENPVVNREVVLQVMDVENHELIPELVELREENIIENEAIKSRGEDLGSNTIEDLTGYENRNSEIPQEEINSDDDPTVSTGIVPQDIEVENHELLPDLTELREENNTQKEAINIGAEGDLSRYENTNSEMSEKVKNLDEDLEDNTEAMPQDMSAENHGFISESTELREDNNTENEAVSSIAKALVSNTVEDLSGNKNTNPEISQKEINLDEDPKVDTKVALQDMSVEDRALVPESAELTEDNNTENQAINSRAEDPGSNNVEDSGNENKDFEISQKEISLNENPIVNTDVLQDMDVESHELIPESTELREENSTENEAIKCKAVGLCSNTIEDLSENENTNSEILQKLTNLDEEKNTEVMPQVMDVENLKFIPEPTDIRKENNTENEAINGRGEDLGSNTIEDLTGNENTNMDISQRDINTEEDPTVIKEIVPQDMDVENHKLIPESTKLPEENNTENEAINSKAADLGSNTVEDLSGNENTNSEMSQKVTNLDEDPRVDTEVVPQDVDVEDHKIIPESTELREEINTENEATNSIAEDLGSNNVEDLSENENTNSEISRKEIMLNKDSMVNTENEAINSRTEDLSSSTVDDLGGKENPNSEISQKEINLDEDSIVNTEILPKEMDMENHEFLQESIELREENNTENEASNSKADDLGSNTTEDSSGKEKTNLEISQKEISLNDDPIVETEGVLEDMDVQNHKFIPESTVLIEENNTDNEAINSKAEDSGPNTDGDLGRNENTNSEISQKEINLDKDPVVETEVQQTKEKIQVDEEPENTKRENTREVSQQTLAEERKMDQGKPIDTADAPQLENEENTCMYDEQIQEVKETHEQCKSNEMNESVPFRNKEIESQGFKDDCSSKQIQNEQTPVHSEASGQNVGAEMPNQDNEECRIDASEVNNTQEVAEHEEHRNEALVQKVICTNASSSGNEMDTSSSEVRNDETLLLAEQTTESPPGISQTNNAEEGAELGVHEQSIERNEDDEPDSNKPKLHMEMAVNSIEESQHTDDREGIPLDQQEPNHLASQDNEINGQPTQTQSGNGILTAIEPSQYIQEWEPNDSKQEEYVSNATKPYIDGHNVDETTPHETDQTEGKQPVELQKNFLEPSSPSEATSTTQNKEDCSVTLQDLNEEKEEDSTPEKATQRELQVSSSIDLCGDLPYIPAVEEVSNTEEYLVPEIQSAHDPQNNKMKPRSCTNNYSHEINSEADQFQNNSQQTVKVSCADDTSIRPISENYGHTSEEVSENQEETTSPEQLIETNNEEQTIDDIIDGRGRQEVKSEMAVEESKSEEDYGPHATSAYDSTKEKLVPAGSVEIVERSSEPGLYKESKKVEDEIREEKEETNEDTESHEPALYEIYNDADRDGKTLSNTECNTKSDECSITISKNSKEISEEPNITVTSTSLEEEAVGEIFQQNKSGERTENEVRPMEPKMDASELSHQMNVPKPDNMDIEKEKQQESKKGLECCSTLEPQQGNDRILFTEIEVPENMSSREIDPGLSEAKLKVHELQSEGKVTSASDVHMDCHDAEKISAAEIIASHICQEIETEDRLKQTASEHQEQRPETSTIVTDANDKTFKEEVLHDESAENTFMSFDNPAEIVCSPEEREIEHPSLEVEANGDLEQKQDLKEKHRTMDNSVKTDPKELSSEFGVESSAEVKSDTEDSTLEILSVKEVCHLNGKREIGESSQFDLKSQSITGEEPESSYTISTDNHTKNVNFEQVNELQSEKLAISEGTGSDTQLQTVNNEHMGESSSPKFEVHEAVATDAAGEEEMHGINTTVASEDPALVQPPLSTTKSCDETKKPVIADKHSANTTFSVSQVSGINNTPPTETNAAEEKVSEQQSMKKVGNQDSNITRTMQVEKEEQLQGNYEDLHQSSQLQELCHKDSVNKRIDEPVDTVDVIYNGKNAENFTKEGPISSTNEVSSLEPVQSVIMGKEEITAEKHNEIEVKSMPPPTISDKRGGEHLTVTQNLQAGGKNAAEEPKTEKEKEDTENDHGEEDSELIPMISEASRDMELKTQNKKSLHILSGMGSKMKNSISKVKKAMACASPQFSPDDVIIKLNKSKKS